MGVARTVYIKRAVSRVCLLLLIHILPPLDQLQQSIANGETTKPMGNIPYRCQRVGMGQLVSRLLVRNGSVRFGSRIDSGCHSQTVALRGSAFGAFAEEVNNSSAIQTFAPGHAFFSDTILLCSPLRGR